MNPLPRILRSLTLALAALALSHAAPVAVVSYTYDTTQPNSTYGPWGDAGNVKLTDGVIPAATNYGDAGHIGFYASLPNPQITLDLGTNYSLATVKLSYWADNGATFFGPRNDLGDRLLISVSNDNISYSTPVSYSPFSGPLGQEVTSSMDVTGKSGRYVRLLVQSHTDPAGVQWLWLSEVAVSSTAPDTGATQTRVETTADGSGTVVGAQSITAGNSITVYAVTRNASGAFVGNPSATWSLQSTTGGVVSGDLVASGPSAVFTGHLTGTAIIRAFASGFVGNSGTQTVSAGAANKLAFTTQPGGGQPGTAWAAQPVVSVQDAGGNTVTSNTSTVTLAISNNAGPGGVLSGTKAKAAVAGVAAFSTLSIDVYGTGYTLSATGGSLTPATSTAFNITSTATVALTKPITRQVVQRGSANTGNIAIAGTYAGSPSRIEARALVMAGSGNSGSDTAWIAITPSPTGGTFSGSLGPVSAGGWYQVEVRSVTAGAPGVTSSVQRVGVGDIYLTAGQSNSANYGTPAAVCADDRVSSYNYADGSWAKAADPMPGPDGPGGSVWTRLGDLLAARDNLPVAFVCMGQGSSEVSQWVPGTGGYYASHITVAVQAFPVNGFRAFLWHQGESDAIANTTPAVYQTRLNSVISQSRVDAGWSVPWYISEASFHPYTSLSQEEPVVAGQRRVIEGDALVFPGPVTDDFHLNGGVETTGWGYGVHFNAAGLADFAAQWAAVLGGSPDLAPKNADFESNTALADGASGSINTGDATSPSVIGWRALAASGEAVADGDCGYYNPDNASYSGASDTGAGGGVLPHMSGRHVAYLSNSTAGAGFLQTRRTMLLANQIYTLTVALGVRGNGNTFGGATLEILANGSIIASRSVTRTDLNTLNGGNASNTFTDVSLQASTGASVTAGQALAIRIRKTSGAGTYLDFDNVRLELVPNTPPTAPTGLSATPMDAAVALSWTASPGATSYKVSVTPGALITTAASPYTVTGLTNGISYQFMVLGTNSVGDGAYCGVVSATPVAGVSTTTTLSALSSSIYGNPVSFTATVVPAPTTGGTVIFYDNNVALSGPVTVNTSTGVAQFTTSSLSAGSHPITATFSGVTGFNGSSAGSKTQSVNAATPSVSVTGSISLTYNTGAQGPNTATTGGSSGTVTFSYAGASGTVYPASSTPPTNAGSYTCTATVAADANYLSASSAATSFTISKATPVITWANPSPIIFGAVLGSSQLNATSGGVAGNFVYTPASGTVLTEGSHTLSTQFSPSVTANYNSPAPMTVTILVRPVGSSNITAADSYPLTLYAGAGWGNPPADAISATDLMEAGQSTFSSITNNATPLWGSNSELNDGLHYPFVGYGEGGGFTVTFNTSVNTAGYDIISVTSYSANQDPGDRISQKYDVEYHVVGGATTWTLLSGDLGATVDRLFTGSHAYNGVDIGGTMAVTISGLSLTGVDQLRFTIHKNSCPTSYETLYTELDVFGTATVASTPYDTWGNGSFAHSFTDKDPTHDPDGDGMTNFQEFAFGLDPTSGASLNPVTPLIGNQFTYTRNADSGLVYTVESSTDLTVWNPAVTTELIGTPNAKGVRLVTVTVTNAPANGKLFVRVQAQ
ncbi:MAG: Ig-like domain repeat protein [Verrucomicrobiota bacterium]